MTEDLSSLLARMETEDPKLHAYVLQYAREFNCEPYTVIREALAEYLRNHLPPEF